jgi:hypothetical protein
MTGHLTQEQCERYASLSMTPNELLTADDHLAECAQCRDRISVGIPITEQIAGVQADLTHASSAPSHLPFDIMLLYLDDQLGSADREVASSHILNCPGCAGEMEDLRRFRAEMSTYPNLNFGPVSQPGLLDRLRKWSSPMRLTGLLGAAAVAASLLLVTLNTSRKWTGVAATGSNLSSPGQTSSSNPDANLDRYQSSRPLNKPQPPRKPHVPPKKGTSGVSHDTLPKKTPPPKPVPASR